MARDETPPFERGQTAGVSASTDQVHLEGKEYVFEDIDPTNKTARTGRKVVCRIVRNASSGALLPKRLVTFKSDTKHTYARVDGYADTTAEGPAYPVDEHLPSTGVAANDLFYVVVRGPALCQQGLTTGSATNIAVGDVLVSQTAATSGATTAGRCEKQDLTGATSVLGGQIQNRIGRALSAKTTSEGGDVLVEVAGNW